MGASLTIEGMGKFAGGPIKLSESHVRLGYFRDTYNEYGLFSVMTNTLGKTFSWWITNDREDLFENDMKMTPKGCKKYREDLFEDDMKMTPEGCKKYWNEMKPNIRLFLRAKKYYRYNDHPIDGEKDKYLIRRPKEIEEIKDHALLFDRFFTYACQLGKPIYWSV